MPKAPAKRLIDFACLRLREPHGIMPASSPRPSANLGLVVSGLLRASALCVPVAAFVGSQTARAVEAALTAAIPSQALPRALHAFADQTGLQFVYLSRVVRNQTSTAVPAGLRPQEALTRLLQGTGLRFEHLTERTVRILESIAPAAVPSSQGEPLPTVIVTANRREESLQEVPIAIQVLTAATLQNLNATTFDDYVNYLPGVTAHGVGPAQNNIYIRGLATGDSANQASGFGGSFPNVAIYLDEQSAQLPGRNLDVYAADLDRIEILEGPQGTLFGAGAEAGVLRYITNKPKLNVMEAEVHAGYATTAGGDRSGALDAVINLPILPDTLALRGVIYNETRGGYIANTPATFARAATDASIGYANYPAGCGGKGNPCEVPPNSVVLSNASLVGRAINPVTYQGIRVEGLYQLSERWSALLSQSYQNIDAQGVFAEEAVNSLGQPQPDLTVQLFNPSYNKDRFENTALTIDGAVSDLHLVYAGSYLVRNVQQVQDYTSYVHGGLYVDYYQCVNPGNTSATARCFSPSSYWRAQERNTHQSQELRLSTPNDWRIRGVGGLFYENYLIQDESDWFYLTALPYFNPIAPPTGYYALNGKEVCPCTPGAVFLPGPVTSINPDARPLGDAYFNDVTRGYNQKATYASVDFDLIPQSLSLTTGTRYYDTNTREEGSLASSFGCRLYGNPFSGPVPDPCVNRIFSNLNQLQLTRTYAGFRSRANLSWKPGERILLYYTWSQGFRAGTFNRGFFTPTQSSPLYPGSAPYQAQAFAHGGWTAPLSSAPDTLVNNEVGWKTSWRDATLQWNGAVYQEDWRHAQTSPADPLFFGGGGATINGGTYRVRGVEMSAVARIARRVTLEIGAAWNHSALVKQGTFYWADGTPINFGDLVTANGTKVVNPTGALGSTLAAAPTFQGTIRARYECDIGRYQSFAQIGALHQSQSLAATSAISFLQASDASYDLPPFTSLDAALGLGRDAWLAQIYGVNLTNTRAQLWENGTLGYEAITVNRPRTVGLRFSYKFPGARDR
jgi:iron complex outermembrane recepter protein